MKGRNELHLNTATMIEIVQKWLSEQMPAASAKVTGVTWKHDERSFVVETTDDDKPASIARPPV